MKNDVILLSTREQTLFMNFDFLYLKTPLERLRDFSIFWRIPETKIKTKTKQKREKNNQVAEQIMGKQGSNRL